MAIMPQPLTLQNQNKILQLLMPLLEIVKLNLPRTPIKKNDLILFF
jgi:hypothetical protein